jgi:DUF2075 family protein
MLVYQGTKTTFVDDVEDGVIADKIRDCIYERMGRQTSEPEFRSWQNSMQFMNTVVNIPDIPGNCGVAIEYNIPQTSKRVDFILSGYDKDNVGQANIVELKQWESVKAVDDRDAIVNTYTGGAERNVAHPSYQAWSYARTIYDYNESVRQRQIRLKPCTYLHNYKLTDHDPLLEPQYQEFVKQAPVFTKTDMRALREFLEDGLDQGDDKAVLEQIDNGRIRPSKSLQDSLAKMLEGSQEFILLDDQKVVYEEALYLARKSQKDGKKRVYIVSGGPGTGKSVVAINLLVQLTTESQNIRYVSKNSAPRNVYKKKLKGQMTGASIDALFQGSGKFTDMARNEMDTVVVDEAHRLTEKSDLYGTRGENQIKEIINAARFSVFFIDESQRVTINDIGSVQAIRDFAQAAGAEIYEDALASQFRCNGSDGYLSWIDDVLEIRDTANHDYDLEGIVYDFEVMDTPDELQKVVVDHNTSNKARILAGYCWDWPTKQRANADYHDIQIGDWGISWNLNNTETYAIDPDSVKEAGCIHTTQGLEFDYVGVIIGDDMRFENGHVVTDFTKRAKTDKSLFGIKKMAKSDPEKAEAISDEIIKNTYRALMTRGMKGCFVYCTDPNLAEYLKRRKNNDFTTAWSYEAVRV